MPIPAGHAHYVFVGTLPGGEVFETGFWATSNIASDGDASDAAAGARNAWTGSPRANLLALMPAGAVLQTVRVYAYTGGPTAAFVAEAPFTAQFLGAGTDAHPLQTALVFTTLTGFAGRRNRGRMYWPAAGADISGTDFQVTATAVNNALGALKDFFADFNSATVGGGVVSVLSQVAGQSRPVTMLRADTRADIQRRRANKQAITQTLSIVL